MVSLNILKKLRFTRKFKPFFTQPCEDLKTTQITPYFHIPDTSLLLSNVDSWQQILKKDYDVEHTSANPVGKPHLGNIASALVGDLLVKCIDTRPIFFVNDAGKNAIRYLEGCTKSDRQNAYQVGDADSEIGKKITDQILTEGLTSDQKELIELSLREIEQSLEQCGVRTDFHYYYESNYLKDAIKFISESQKDQLGRALLKGHVVGTSTGRPLYLLPDYFYHLFYPSNKTLIHVLGADHSNQYRVLKQICSDLGPKFKVVYVPKISYDNRKLSKRSNVLLSLDDWFGSSLDDKKTKILVFKFLLYYNARAAVIDLAQHNYEKYRTYVVTKPSESSSVNTTLSQLIALKNIVRLKTFLKTDLCLYGKYLEEVFRVAKKGLNQSQQSEWNRFIEMQ